MTPALADLDWLASEAGARALAALALEDLGEARTLPLLDRLRKTYTPAQAAAALELARLRHKAVEKFAADHATRMYFTRDALEQASARRVRAYRAWLVAREAPARVIDLCCGIGADALSFAAAMPDAEVLGVDLDPIRVAMARLNAAALGLAHARFEVGDVRALAADSSPLADADLIFFDPARRDDAGRRIHDVERYIPPLSLVGAWAMQRQSPAPVLAKLSPGVEIAQLAPYLDAGGWVEFISVAGELKEALLHLNRAPFPWVRGAAEASAHRRCATALAEDGVGMLHFARHGDEPPATLADPRGWLCEPDPAIIRAGLVRDLAAMLRGAQLDEAIAYFTTEARPESDWVRAWAIHDWMPFNLKKLRAYLRERGVGRVTVKKRGSPLEPEALIAALKLKTGDAARTLVLTQRAGAPVVVICEEMPVGGVTFRPPADSNQH